MASIQSEKTITIPVVDIGPLRDGSDPVSVGSALHEASRDIGFIYVKNHGIPGDLIERAHSAAIEFFRQSQHDKERVSISENHRGWLRLGGAVMAEDMPHDLKESYLWGPDENSSLMDHPLRGPNLWPEDLRDFREVSRIYFDLAHQVAETLMKGFAFGLGLDEGFFLNSKSPPLSRASYVYYPSQPASAPGGQFGVGPHTDFGVLTVLYQDSVGGLQVQRLDKSWIDAPPLDGTLVVNVGDLLHRWTAGEYRSTPHRVINSSRKERLSIVFAYDPGPETLIDARDVVGQNAENLENPITCGDYLTWRFKRAFAYRRN